MGGLTGAIAMRAAELRARYGLRTPDAIHCATALAAGCDGLLTDDKAFLRTSAKLPVYLFDASAQGPK